MSLVTSWRPRAYAALVHFASSLLVAAFSAYLVFGLWYPPPYSALSGGTELFLLLVSVDVLIGPLLTFAVFDRAKLPRVLRRDLTTIVVLQLAAMIYGLHTMAIARPVVMALEVDRFRVVIAQAVLEGELPQAPEGLRSVSWTGPRLLSTRLPDSAEKADAVMLAMAGADLGMRPSFWLPWDAAARATAKRSAKPVVELAKQGPAAAKVLSGAASELGRHMHELVYLPILGRRSDWVALLDRDTGELLGYAPVNGF